MHTTHTHIRRIITIKILKAELQDCLIAVVKKLSYSKANCNNYYVEKLLQYRTTYCVYVLTESSIQLIIIVTQHHHQQQRSYCTNHKIIIVKYGCGGKDKLSRTSYHVIKKDKNKKELLKYKLHLRHLWTPSYK